jgi:hypothetical protein
MRAGGRQTPGSATGMPRGSESWGHCARVGKAPPQMEPRSPAWTWAGRIPKVGSLRKERRPLA